MLNAQSSEGVQVDRSPSEAYQTKYRVSQLVNGRLGNRHVDDFDGLVLHHPISNTSARVSNGVVVDTQRGGRRSYGVIGGQIEEIETRQSDARSSAIGPDQVLLIKDFILEDSRIAPFGRGARDVDVPAPFAGYVGRVIPGQGLVDILDRKDGELLARIRHLKPINVSVGDTIQYGQTLGTQGAVGLGRDGRKHVHMEVDTGQYQQYANYVEDLVSGRLALCPADRGTGIEPRPVVDDGVTRVGESNGVVRIVQQRLNEGGFRGADGERLAEDGIYRLSMQRAVINYQAAEGLPQSGDLDAATLQRIAPTIFPPAVNSPRNPASPALLDGQAQLHDAPAGEAPSDPLFAQAQDAMQHLEESLGRGYDAHSERMAASVACLAKANGFDHIDHIVLSSATERAAQGAHVIAVQGAMNDPAHLRAQMGTDDALAVPADASLARLARIEPMVREPSTVQADPCVGQDPSVMHRMG
nr:XVIPCD domain-containing protein [Stenotrophomonas sp. CFBP 13718]